MHFPLRFIHWVAVALLLKHFHLSTSRKIGTTVELLAFVLALGDGPHYHRNAALWAHWRGRCWSGWLLANGLNRG